MMQMKREIEVHSRLKHPNIVEFFGYFQDDERCEGGSLRLSCFPTGGSGCSANWLTLPIGLLCIARLCSPY